MEVYSINQGNCSFLQENRSNDFNWCLTCLTCLILTMMPSAQKEWRRIAHSATKIVSEDIQSQVYKCTQYPPGDRFLNEIESFIHETVKFSIKTLLLRKTKGYLYDYYNRSTALAQSIISELRPQDVFWERCWHSITSSNRRCRRYSYLRVYHENKYG